MADGAAPSATRLFDLRISTDEDHQPYSPDAQATRLGSYVGSQDGWALMRSFSDQVSGATLERPGLYRALSEAGAGRFDLLLVYRVDRWPARSEAWLRSLRNSTKRVSRSARPPGPSTPRPRPGE